MVTLGPRPLVGDGGRFARTLKTALKLYEHPRVAVVAATPTRADYIRQICLRVVQSSSGAVTMYIEDEASDALLRNDHDVLILDPSVAPALREGLRMLARERVAHCSLIEIKKWSKEPPP